MNLSSERVEGIGFDGIEGSEFAQSYSIGAEISGHSRLLKVLDYDEL